jgi:hypothetical protein
MIVIEGLKGKPVAEICASSALLIPLAHSGRRCRWGHEGLETGWSGFGQALAGQPHRHSDNGHRRCRQDMLEMGFRRASIARTADAKGPHCLERVPSIPARLADSA